MKNDALNPTDQQALSLVLEGDIDVFEHFIEKYKSLVFKIVIKHAGQAKAEELAQEVFVKAYKSLPGFNASGSFAGWISKIAVRTCCDHWRVQYNKKEFCESQLNPDHLQWAKSSISQQNHLHILRKKEHAETVKWVMAKLPAKDRMVLTLVYLEGMQIKEAAQTLGCSTVSARVRLLRSRRRAKQILQKYINMTEGAK